MVFGAVAVALVEELFAGSLVDIGEVRGAPVVASVLAGALIVDVSGMTLIDADDVLVVGSVVAWLVGGFGVALAAFVTVEATLVV